MKKPILLVALFGVAMIQIGTTFAQEAQPAAEEEVSLDKQARRAFSRQLYKKHVALCIKLKKENPDTWLHDFLVATDSSEEYASAAQAALNEHGSVGKAYATVGPEPEESRLAKMKVRAKQRNAFVVKWMKDHEATRRARRK